MRCHCCKQPLPMDEQMTLEFVKGRKTTHYCTNCFRHRANLVELGHLAWAAWAALNKPQQMALGLDTDASSGV